MNGRIFSTAPGGEERGERPPQRQVVGAVDLADAQRRLALRARDAHLALVVHAVGGVGLVLVREGVAVAGGLRHRVVAGDEPESAVVLVPRDRASTAEVRVDFPLVEVEVVGMMVEVNDCDVGAVTSGISQRDCD